MGVIAVGELLRKRDNEYASVVADYERRTRRAWSAHASLGTAIGPGLSVVIPAYNVVYSITAVLDSLAAARREGLSFEVIVVDDHSDDATPNLAGAHPATDIAVSLPKRSGPAVARNVGTLLASRDTVLYLDADMVVRPQALAEHAARAHSNAVLLGFRHNVPHDDERREAAIRGDALPSLGADHRVNWYAQPGRLLYTNSEVKKFVRARPLDDTDDLRQLGRGATYYDWDLPRMVVTAMVSAPRRAVLDAGGFHPEFGAGWGVEDTHLGAKLIASGLKVVPLRRAVGFHLDPPDAVAQWRAKLQLWRRNIALYRRLLSEPLPAEGEAQLRVTSDPILERARQLCP
jgi:glycosyltransferase involved in cell wall biosynthesis